CQAANARYPVCAGVTKGGGQQQAQTVGSGGVGAAVATHKGNSDFTLGTRKRGWWRQLAVPSYTTLVFAAHACRAINDVCMLRFGDSAKSEGGDSMPDLDLASSEQQEAPCKELAPVLRSVLR